MSPHDPKAWMWAEACELIERAERLQRQFFQIASQNAQHPVWAPPVDVFETEEDLWVLLALPGVTSSEIELVISGNALQVIAERPLPAALRRAAVHRMEIPYGRFERIIELPAGHFELHSREMQDGCLCIRLRKFF